MDELEAINRTAPDDVVEARDAISRGQILDRFNQMLSQLQNADTCTTYSGKIQEIGALFCDNRSAIRAALQSRPDLCANNAQNASSEKIAENANCYDTAQPELVELIERAREAVDCNQLMHDIDPRDILTALRTPTYKQASFQSRVGEWMLKCFTPEITADGLERCDRFIEEALEFVQANDYSADRAHALVDYVFGRPKGEVNQEVGGVMVTLAAACNVFGVDISEAGEAELARIMRPEVIEKIRAKQATKPTGSALPVAQKASGTYKQGLEDAAKVAEEEAQKYPADPRSQGAMNAAKAIRALGEGK